MSLISKFITALDDPRLAWRRLLQAYFRTRNHDGIQVMQEDWDNLLILDACRYDLFREVFPHDGDVRPVISSGSDTSEFLSQNFVDGEFFDTVYVSANPHVKRLGVDECFHACVPLWETHWDDATHTVLPEEVTEQALEAQTTYPNKRLIVHFIQPHYPFLGETGREIKHRTITGGGLVEDELEYDSIWRRLEAGEIDEKTVWKAYHENLELAIPPVRRLVEELEGKTVVTSDHGNSFGQLGIYGHPQNCYVSSLVRVPWLEIEGKQRKTITAEQPKERSRPSEDVTSRLQDLGYHE